jgi:hypothetical protein
VSPMSKYALGRIGLFVAVAAPLILIFPKMNVLLTLMIAVLVSAALAFFLLRRWREEVGEHMLANSRKKAAEKEKLRAALAGDDETNEKDESVPSSSS